MNNKGSVLFYGFMLGLVVIILALALAPAVVESGNGVLTSMNCTNESISNFDKVTCYAADLNSFYFIGSLIFIAGALITARYIF